MADKYKQFLTKSQEAQFSRVILTQNAQKYTKKLENPDFLSSSSTSKSKFLNLKSSYLQPEVKVVQQNNGYKIKFGDNDEYQAIYSANMANFMNKYKKTPKFKYHQSDNDLIQNSDNDKFLPNLPTHQSSYLQLNIDNLNNNLSKDYQKYIKESPLMQSPQHLSFQVYRVLEKSQNNMLKTKSNIYNIFPIPGKKSMNLSQTNSSNLDILSTKKSLDENYFNKTAQDLHYAETKLSRMFSQYQNKQKQLLQIENNIKEKISNKEALQEMNKVQFYQEMQDFKEKIVPKIQLEMFDDTALKRQEERQENYIQQKHWHKYQKMWGKSQLLSKLSNSTKQQQAQTQSHKILSLTNRFNTISRPAIKSIINQVQAREEKYSYNNSLIKSFNLKNVQ